MNEIKILAIDEEKIPRNYFVVDRDENENVELLTPPRHFKYEVEDRVKLCYYKIVEDENDPPLPASILRLRKMSMKRLKAIAARNDLGGWANLDKPNLLKFLERHRYVFTDDFYKQRSLKLQLQAWVELFAVGNLAKHYVEVMLNALTKSGYYKPDTEPEYCCWWKVLPLSNLYEIDLFLGGPDSVLMFHRKMGLRYRKMIIDIETPIRESIRRGECEEVEGGNWRWKNRVSCVWENLGDLVERHDRVWDEMETKQFLSFSKEVLEKFCRLFVLGDLNMEEELKKLSIKQKKIWKTFSET